jgi:hypothetical protein
VASLALVIVAFKRGLRLDDLRRKEGNLQDHFADGVFVLRIFSEKKTPNINQTGKTI